jgi:hypothetical protein
VIGVSLVAGVLLVAFELALMARFYLATRQHGSIPSTRVVSGKSG